MIGRLVRKRERIGFILLAAFVTAFLSAANLADRLDHQIYDLLSRAWTPPEASNITIVTIDEPSLSELGRFPWSRRMHAKLVDRLAEAGAHAVAFDVIFAEPDWQDLGGDTAFAEAITRFGRVALPVFADVRVRGERPQEIRPLAKLVEAGVRLGHVEMAVDSDGVVRRISRFAGLDEARHPALTVALLNAAANGAQPRATALDPVDGTAWVNEDWLLVPFSARSRFDHMTFADVVQGRIAPDRLRDRLVLVGSTASGLGSTFSTPLSGNGTSMPGVVVHAHMLNALSHGVVWRDLAPGPRIMLLTLFVVAVVVSLQLARRPFFLTMAALGCLLAAAAAMLQMAGIWIAPAAAVVAAIGALLGWGVIVRQKEQARARAERERASVTLRAIADAVVTVGSDGRVDYLNPAAQAITGWPVESAKGRLLAEVLRVHTKELEPINLADSSLGSERVRARLRGRNGEIHEILLSRGQIFDDQRSPSGHVIVLHDITEQELARRLFERSEERRRQLERDLQHAGRLSAVGEVSASIAHEVNQPLTAITTYASAARQLLKSNHPSSQQKLLDAVHKMALQAERAGLVIRRLRRFFEKDTEEVGLHDLGEMVDEALELALLGSSKLRIEVVVDLDRPVPPVACDRIQIQQVIVNLVRNAVEAMADMPRRRLSVTSRLRDSEVEISVSDTGTGIPADIRAALFQPFNSSKPGGMGLGLSISRSIIEAHGGVLRAVPADGGGAIFTFNLPLQVEVDA